MRPHKLRAISVGEGGGGIVHKRGKGERRLGISIYILQKMFAIYFAKYLQLKKRNCCRFFKEWCEGELDVLGYTLEVVVAGSCLY